LLLQDPLVIVVMEVILLVMEVTVIIEDLEHL
jgi:hypothetical protein